MKDKKLTDQETGKEYIVLDEKAVQHVEKPSNAGEKLGKELYQRLKKKKRVR